MSKEEKIRLVEAEFLKRGIRIAVEACGCCGSPMVKIEVDGVVMLDADEANIDMISDKK